MNVETGLPREIKLKCWECIAFWRSKYVRNSSKVCKALLYLEKLKKKNITNLLYQNFYWYDIGILQNVAFMVKQIQVSHSGNFLLNWYSREKYLKRFVTILYIFLAWDNFQIIFLLPYNRDNNKCNFYWHHG